jgi:hypothetical protein
VTPKRAEIGQITSFIVSDLARRRSALPLESTVTLLKDNAVSIAGQRPPRFDNHNAQKIAVLREAVTSFGQGTNTHVEFRYSDTGRPVLIRTRAGQATFRLCATALKRTGQ